VRPVSWDMGSSRIRALNNSAVYRAEGLWPKGLRLRDIVGERRGRRDRWHSEGEWWEGPHGRRVNVWRDGNGRKPPFQGHMSIVNYCRQAPQRHAHALRMSSSPLWYRLCTVCQTPAKAGASQGGLFSHQPTANRTLRVPSSPTPSAFIPLIVFTASPPLLLSILFCLASRASLLFHSATCCFLL
jgi:hypothetical protein